MTHINSNGHEAYEDGRSKQLQAEANKRYRQSTKEAYNYLKSICSELGITPSELITQSNVQSVARLIRVALEESPTNV